MKRSLRLTPVLILMGSNGAWEKEGYKIKMRAAAGNEPGSFLKFYISAFSKDGVKVASTTVIEHEDRTHATPHGTNVCLGHQRKGLATAMYAHYEMKRQVSMRPDSTQSDAAKALWIAIRAGS